MKTHLPMIITITLILIIVSVAFAYGNAKATCTGQEKKAAIERLSDYDWSKTCPAAGCRNNNEE